MVLCVDNHSQYSSGLQLTMRNSDNIRDIHLLMSTIHNKSDCLTRKPLQNVWKVLAKKVLPGMVEIQKIFNLGS